MLLLYMLVLNREAKEALGGRVDVLVNNAGYSNANQKIKIHEETIENFDIQMAINVCLNVEICPLSPSFAPSCPSTVCVRVCLFFFVKQ